MPAVTSLSVVPVDVFGHGEGRGPTVYHKAGRKQLLRAFAACGYTRGAEIGVWRGEFAAAMCQAVPGLQLRCVDCWGGDPTYHDTKADTSWLKVRRCAEDRLRTYGCLIDARRSLEAAQDVPNGSLDFVYIDGNHGRDQVYADLKTWAPKVRVGGMVSGHDYKRFVGRPDIQVKAAVDAFVRDHGITDWCVLSRDRNPSFCWVVS